MQTTTLLHLIHKPSCWKRCWWLSVNINKVKLSFVKLSPLSKSTPLEVRLVFNRSLRRFSFSQLCLSFYWIKVLHMKWGSSKLPSVTPEHDVCLNKRFATPKWLKETVIEWFTFYQLHESAQMRALLTVSSRCTWNYKSAQVSRCNLCIVEEWLELVLK